jgi:manganese transport protein
LVGIIYFGEQSLGKMLVLSQVVLSLQLPFAVFPLILFTGNRQMMGPLVNPSWVKGLARLVGLMIAGVNIWLLGKLFL